MPGKLRVAFGTAAIFLLFALGSAHAASSGALSLGAATYSVSETAGAIDILVERTGGSSGAASVTFMTLAGTANYNVDYGGVHSVLNWANGDAAAKTISIKILNSGDITSSKQFSLILSNAVGASLGTISTAKISILAPTGGAVAFSASGYSVVRASTDLLISVNRSGSTTGAASVKYQTKAGTAVYSVDYQGTNGVLNWAAGDAAAKTFKVHIDDPATTATKQFSVQLLTPSGGAILGSPATATVTITTPPAVTITVTPGSVHAISPYIYGINGATYLAGVPSSLTLDRLGGNRLTAYNWETNASNAGSDYLYENDAALSSSAVPADAVTQIISADQASSLATLVTFQMQGLVAGDENGPVSTANPPDMSRFKTVVYQKSSKSSAAFTTTPSTTDAYVYMDEFAWALDKKFAGQNIFNASPATQHVFAQLDNEPELWNSTHYEVQGATEVSSDTYIAKTIALATALKTQFPNLQIFGPVHYGFYGIYAWNGELSPTPTGNNWFPDKYLPAIKSASVKFGHPLVDVYDFHWYPEATDGSGNRITGLNSATLTDAQVQAIVQSPRSLWDSTYSENSWIPQALGGPIYILGRLQSRIATENPGMKLSITEYNNGGALHIAGTIAQADNLGIFGAQGLFAANMWSLVSSQSYLLAGFRAFRNFDGAHHHFGDTSVETKSSNTANVVAYVSTDSTRTGRVVIVAINRSSSSQITAITGQTLAGTAHLYQMTALSAQAQSTITPIAAGTQAVSGSSITVSLPALSVTTIDIY